LSTFSTSSSNYPLDYDPSNEALIFFGQDIIKTSTAPFTFGSSFTISLVFSFSEFYLTSNLLLFSPDDLTNLRPLNIMVTAAGAIQLTVNGVVVLTSANGVIALNTPYLITLTKNGNTWKLFKNGTPIVTKTITTPVIISNNRLYLAYNFVGLLDEVAIYDSALTPTVIANQNTLFSLPTTSCSGCSNKGFCGKLNSGTQCYCFHCFSGSNCETKIPSCLNPCLNGIFSGGSCQCVPGYSGSTCASPVTCSAITGTSTGNFPQSDAYKGVIGTCQSGSGNPKRQCLHDGTWQTVSSPCA